MLAVKRSSYHGALYCDNIVARLLTFVNTQLTRQRKNNLMEKNKLHHRRKWKLPAARCMADTLKETFHYRKKSQDIFQKIHLF